jgi:hypothetical protein
MPLVAIFCAVVTPGGSLLVSLLVAAALAIACAVLVGKSAGLRRKAVRSVCRLFDKELSGLGAEGNILATRSACAEIASRFEQLFAGYEYYANTKMWDKFMKSRRLVAAYKGTLQASALTTLSQASAFVYVPPEIVRCARNPRSTDDLRQLHGWFLHVAKAPLAA